MKPAHWQIEHQFQQSGVLSESEHFRKAFYETNLALLKQIIHTPLLVAAGEDRFGEQRGLGISSISFKVTPQDSDGLLIIENTFREKRRACPALTL